MFIYHIYCIHGNNLILNKDNGT